MADQPDQSGSDADARSSGDDADRPIDKLELFFDLVFVFAMSQVTQLMLDDVSWTGFGQGALALTAVWWAWVGYAWLTNTTADAGMVARVLVVAAMAAMLITAAALPRAFADQALVFGLAYAMVRVIHMVLQGLDARSEGTQSPAVARLYPTLLAGPALVLVAAFVDSPYREFLWVTAALIDLGGPLFVGVSGLRVLPVYFVDRHGAIIIIALGEAITRAGVGASQRLDEPGVLVAIALAVLIAALLWWSYFGLTSAAQERMLSILEDQRARHARDAYSYLHLPIVGGIVFFALGVNLAVVGVLEPLAPLAALALAGGVALAYVGDVAYRWREHHVLAADRLVAAFASAAVIGLALVVPAVASLLALLLIGVVRAGWEARRHPVAGPV